MRKVLLAGVVAALVLAAVTETAQAQRFFVGSRGGWGVGTPYFSYGYGNYYGSPYYGSGYYGYRPYYGGYYSSSYNAPYYRSGLYTQPYYGSGLYSYSSPAYSGYSYSPVYGTQYYSAGTPYSGINQASYQSFYAGSGAGQGNQAQVRVTVPDNVARVWLDGHLTQQTGLDRLYISPPLEPGKGYTYTIKASWMENGREVTREKTVPVQAGQTATVNFAAGQDQNIRPAVGKPDEPRDPNRPPAPPQ